MISRRTPNHGDFPLPKSKLGRAKHMSWGNPSRLIVGLIISLDPPPQPAQEAVGEAACLLALQGHSDYDARQFKEIKLERTSCMHSLARLLLLHFDSCDFREA